MKSANMRRSAFVVMTVLASPLFGQADGRNDHGATTRVFIGGRDDISTPTTHPTTRPDEDTIYVVRFHAEVAWNLSITADGGAVLFPGAIASYRIPAATFDFRSVLARLERTTVATLPTESPAFRYSLVDTRETRYDFITTDVEFVAGLFRFACDAALKEYPDSQALRKSLENPPQVPADLRGRRGAAGRGANRQGRG
jgi:hypothetical protein